jgi:predicted  nucleic acid-binding Zn-ribbon protein
MAGQLDAIVALQTTLDELTAADRRLNTIPDWMQELHEEHTKKSSDIEAAQETAASADKERREAEAELNDAQEKLKHYQEQISKVSTQREYGALLKEIDTVKERINTAEKLALEALERKEEAEGNQSELEESFKEVEERYQTELTKWTAEKPSVEKQAKKLKIRAEELRTQIPRNVQTLFDRIRDRIGGNAVAPIQRLEVLRSSNAVWHCAACNYNVRPQLVVEIRNEGALNQCESCKRILYLPTDPDVAEA